jgi:hypothetical protein
MHEHALAGQEYRNQHLLTQVQEYDVALGS